VAKTPSRHCGGQGCGTEAAEKLRLSDLERRRKIAETEARRFAP
jgi:hypothetical protein